MSRKLDLSKKLTKDEVAYLEQRGMIAQLEENKRLVRGSTAVTDEAKARAAAEKAEAEAAEAEAKAAEAAAAAAAAK